MLFKDIIFYFLLKYIYFFLNFIKFINFIILKLICQMILQYK